MRAIAIGLLCAAAALSQQQTLPPGFKQARALYFSGADGDKGAYADADRLFSKLYESDPQNPLVEVYYGSLRLLEASHTWALWKKNSLSKQGIKLMDEAVARAPEDLEIRFVRAATTFDLPAFFGRKAQSEQDFDLLASRAKRAAGTGALEPRLAAASLYYHAKFLSVEGQRKQAAEIWNQAIQLAPQSRAARDSRDELKKIGA